jgi:hypothetical protein
MMSGSATTTKRIRKMILRSMWFMTSQKPRLEPSAKSDLPRTEEPARGYER